jgi:hypothetical protein
MEILREVTDVAGSAFSRSMIDREKNKVLKRNSRLENRFK